MIKKINEVKVITYEVKDGFQVEVVEDENGIKTAFFGMKRLYNTHILPENKEMFIVDTIVPDSRGNEYINQKEFDSLKDALEYLIEE